MMLDEIALSRYPHARALRHPHTADNSSEITDGAAVVPLQTMRNLGLHHAMVNVNGEAIALGYVLGETGAMFVGTLLDELKRRDLATGVVTLCIGRGMGIATVLERV